MTTLFDRIWEGHVVARAPEEGVPSILYVDLHLVHEVTSPQAFSGLRSRGLRVHRPGRTVATMDHSTPTLPPRRGDDGAPPRVGRGLDMVLDDHSREQLRTLEDNCREFGIELHALGSTSQGIVHVIGPEMGLTQPGMTIVCGDSHTSTHGAFGALAFGIGTTEVEHVLATQCLLQRKPRAMRVTIDGALRRGVGAKDLILALIARIGIGGATEHVVEYAGDAVQRLDMEARMTVCNMSIEAGARAGMVAPDDTTFQYLASRDHSPKGASWDRAVARWRSLRSDDDARFDREVALDASVVEPMITWGTNPAMGIGVTRAVPSPDDARDAQERSAFQRALDYMALEPGKPLVGRKIDAVFVGSCTNGRIADLRAVARVLEGRSVAEGVRMLVVPGSQRVKRQAEQEGLDRIFRDAGAEWREAGCSMCIAMNGDELRPGEYAVSTSNRNFEGRQGKGGRTFLASPLTAAASAVAGCVADPRAVLGSSSGIRAARSVNDGGRA
jgi:3-isopropylmalate/(R)-2-methylmalate dehydratase large subunit